MTPSDESDDPREPTRRTRARLPDSRQGSLFAVRTLTPDPYEAHSFLGLLETLGEHLFDRRDFPPDQSTGTSAWCPVLMTKLILIQRKNSWSDEQTVDAARQRLDVKACLGLGIHQPGPSAAKLSRHRTMLAERGLLERYERRFLDLVKQIGLLGESEPLLVDSVPVHGAGQVLDTFNLLGAGLRRVLGALAKRQGRAVAEVARELNVQRFLDRSTKAALALDWTDAEAKLGGLSELVAAVGRVLEAADSCQNESPGQQQQQQQPQSETPPGQADEPPDEPVDGDDGPGGGSCAALAAEVETLRAAVERDVEVDAEGVVVGIVERSADDRIISVTDPDMRHGRKSASALIAGFKAHLLVSVVWGWIVGVRLTAANVHDGR
nr:transposase [Planctomycetota bacterium]